MSTTTMLLDHYIELLSHEPPQDAGGHPSVEVHQRVGADWARWHDQAAAFRTLLAPRLLDRAVEERKGARIESLSPEGEVFP